MGNSNINYGGNAIEFGECIAGSYSCTNYATRNYVLSGNINLTADAVIKVDANTTVQVTGTVTTNGHTLTLNPASAGTLTVGSQTVVIPTLTTAIKDSMPTTDISVVNKETTTLDGIRRTVTVNSGGTLMGTGTVNYASISGIIAPGHSPGTLTVTQTLSLQAGSTYQAQLQTSAAGGYDQIQVSDATRTTGNDVNIDPAAILSTSLYTGYNIKQGDKFTIINNLQPSNRLVVGTFSGLAEGAQLTVSGVTFSISYIGGDGNDVVLTALTTKKDPSAPNTGAQPLKLASPIVLIGLGVLTATVLFAVARRRTN
jgi:hypothetical protein